VKKLMEEAIELLVILELKKNVRHLLSKALSEARVRVDRIFKDRPEPSEGLSEALNLISSLTENINETESIIRETVALLESSLTLASTEFSDEDLRAFIKLDKAVFLIPHLPTFPTGRVFQVTLPMSLETVAFHAERYWASRGMRYFFAGVAEGDEIFVQVVGTSMPIFLWLYTEFGDNADVIETLQICDDRSAIDALMRERTLYDDKELNDER
jgi:hypothetical protein